MKTNKNQILNLIQSVKTNKKIRKKSITWTLKLMVNQFSRSNFSFTNKINK